MTDPTWQGGLAHLYHALGRGWLAALRDGLAAGDPALIRGRTCRPDCDPPADAPDPPLEAGCAIVYGLWKSGAVGTVREGRRAFAAAAGATPQGAYRREVGVFIDFWDGTTPRWLPILVVPEIDRLLGEPGPA